MARRTRAGRRMGAGRPPVLNDRVRYVPRLERTDIEALEAIADERGESIAALACEAVRTFLKRQGR